MATLFDSLAQSGVNAIPGGSTAMQAFDQALALIPDGKLKDALSQLKFGLVGVLITKLAGRKYQTGQYRLGERFMRHILQQDPGGNQNVPDSIVPAAQSFFTIALGIDINNDEDLQSLYTGTDAYFQRPDKAAVPRPAVDRAVQIMKSWPMYDPNNTSQWYVPWPINVIYTVPSDPKTMSYHSTLIDKDLPVLLVNKAGQANIKKPFPWIWVAIAIAILVIIILLIKSKHKK